MCRYALKKYKTHYVCFACRKGFKQPPIEDLVISKGDWQKYQKAYLDLPDKKSKYRIENPEIVEYLEEKYINRICKCPECGREMKDVGFDFKAPKKEKTAEWEILKSMYVLGEFFHSCGCDAYGYIPKDKNLYREYLLNSKNNYQQKIKQRDETLLPTELKEYLNYWSLKISMVDEELKKLNL